MNQTLLEIAKYHNLYILMAISWPMAKPSYVDEEERSRRKIV